jgi:hypothetical protein
MSREKLDPKDYTPPPKSVRDDFDSFAKLREERLVKDAKRDKPKHDDT